MKRLTFYAKSNRSGNLMHIETDGCIVNIRVGLTDREGRQVTNVEIIPDDESRGGDGQGRIWHVDGMIGTRVIRQHEPTDNGQHRPNSDPGGVAWLLASKHEDGS